MLRKTLTLLLALVLLATASLAQSRQDVRTAKPTTFDAIIRGGTVYDGTGGSPKRADVGIKGDRIAAVGNLKSATATTIIDATGLAVAPGFINMLSHSESSLITDGRSQSEIRQGVTTQIFGEGSMGPLSDEMKRNRARGQGDRFGHAGRQLDGSEQFVEIDRDEARCPDVTHLERVRRKAVFHQPGLLDADQFLLRI